MAITRTGVSSANGTGNPFTITLPATATEGNFGILTVGIAGSFSGVSLGSGDPGTGILVSTTWGELIDTTTANNVVTIVLAGPITSLNNISIHYGGSTGCGWALATYTGVDTDDPFDVSVVGAPATNSDFPAFTASAAGAFMVGLQVASSSGVNNVAASDPFSVIAGVTNLSVTLLEGETLNAGANLIELDQGTGFRTGAFVLNAATVQTGDRVRSNISEDAGSVLDATTLLATDASISEDFTLADAFTAGDLKQFYEALNPGTPTMRYYPLERQNSEYLRTYDGETKLGRMARTYPPAIFERVNSISALTGSLEVDGESITAQTALEYIFTQWANQYDWFTYESIPDLRYQTPEGVSDNDAYSSGNQLGELWTKTIQIEQTTDNRLTMREIVDQWLSPFPGTILRQNSSGNIELVPRVGPDATTTSVVTLATSDVYDVTIGGPDPRGVVNRVTVLNTPFTAEAGVDVMQAAWFQYKNFKTTESAEFTAPEDRLDITGDEAFNSFANPQFWPARDGFIPGQVIEFTDDFAEPLISATIHYNQPDKSTYESASTDSNPDCYVESTTQISTTNPDWQHAFTLRYDYKTLGILVDYFTLVVRARWVNEPDRRGIELVIDRDNTKSSAVLGLGGFTLSGWVANWEVFLNTISTAYSRTGTRRKATIGIDGGIPAIGGGDAITNSVDAFGVIEETISIDVYDVPTETLEKIGLAYLLENVQPKIIRTVEQSAYRAYPVQFDHIGSRITLPDTTTGIVLSRTYADDFGVDYADGNIESTLRVQVLDSTGIGLIDITTEFLLYDNGNYLTLDSGTIVEAS